MIVERAPENAARRVPTLAPPLFEPRALTYTPGSRWKSHSAALAVFARTLASAKWWELSSEQTAACEHTARRWRTQAPLGRLALGAVVACNRDELPRRCRRPHAAPRWSRRASSAVDCAATRGVCGARTSHERAHTHSARCARACAAESTRGDGGGVCVLSTQHAQQSTRRLARTRRRRGLRSQRLRAQSTRRSPSPRCSRPQARAQPPPPRWNCRACSPSRQASAIACRK